jgi:hypothetical protein
VAETKCAQGRRFQRDPYGAPTNMAAIKSSIGQASALLADLRLSFLPGFGGSPEDVPRWDLVLDFADWHLTWSS